MDNTKYAKWAVVLLLAVGAIIAVLLGFTGQAEAGITANSMAVQVPEAINTAIQIGIVALLTAGLTWVFSVLGIDLRGQAPVLGLAISAWVVSELQNVVNTIPEAYDPWLNIFFRILVAILAPAGLLWLSRKKDNGDAQRLL